MVSEMKIQEFTDALSSRQPTPGGGGASALAGTLGTALGLMVGSLTVGKKKYADVEDDVKRVMGRLEQMQKRLLELADEDARVFAPLAAAYGLPTDTEEAQAHKAEVMAKCLLDASLVPVEIMKQASAALVLLEELEEKGSVMAVSDVGVAVQFLRTALTGAIMNVYINTKSMKDRELADRLNQEAGDMLNQGVEKADAIYGRILKRLAN